MGRSLEPQSSSIKGFQDIEMSEAAQLFNVNFAVKVMEFR